MAGDLYIFYGEDDFSAREALGQLKAELGASEAMDPNTTVLDGRQLPFGQLTMLCDTLPFLAGRRLAVVEGLLGRFEDRPDRRPGPRASRAGGARELGEWAGLADYVGMMPPSTALVLLDGRLSPRNPLLRQLRGVAQVRDFPPLRGAQLQDWIRARAVQVGGRIAPGAARLLANHVGGNLRLLHEETRKLALYAGARPVQEEDVRQLVSYAREASIFVLIDAMIERRRGDAMRSLQQLLKQGAAAPFIVTMLARQLRLMVQAKVLTEEGASDAELGAALGTPSEFVLRKTLQQSQAYTLPELKGLYQRLLEADLAIKTGAMIEEELTLEVLVAEVAGGPG